MIYVDKTNVKAPVWWKRPTSCDIPVGLVFAIKFKLLNKLILTNQISLVLFVSKKISKSIDFAIN